MKVTNKKSNISFLETLKSLGYKLDDNFQQINENKHSSQENKNINYNINFEKALKQINKDTFEKQGEKNHGRRDKISSSIL